MTYTLVLTEGAIADIDRLKKSGQKILLRKVEAIFEELKTTPTIGKGKPEQLKGFRLPTWSRRISNQHRLVYQIDELNIVVLVLAAWGHYQDR